MMMQDRQKMVLNDFYEETIGKAKQYLSNKYPLDICNKDDEDFPQNIQSDFCVVWKITVENSLHPLTLIIAIPKTFPDKLPKIYLSKRDYADIAPIPHVDKNRFVCTRDPNVGFINEDKSSEALLELIKIATEEIINKGIKKENSADFVEEFLAYWNENGKYKYLSLFAPTDKIESLKVVRFSKKFLNSEIIIAKTEEEAQKWLAPFNIEIDEEHIGEALYLPLPEPIYMPLPQNNKDIYEIIKE